MYMPYDLTPPQPFCPTPDATIPVQTEPLGHREHSECKSTGAEASDPAKAHYTALPLLTDLNYRAVNLDDDRATRVSGAGVAPDLTGAEVVRRDRVPARMAMLAAHSALSRKRPSSTRQQQNMWTTVE